jgi:RNA polymerase sigma-70 factor (ECF subfamily)
MSDIKPAAKRRQLWATPIWRTALPPLFVGSGRLSSLSALRSSRLWENTMNLKDRKVDRFTWGLVHRKVRQLIGRDDIDRQDYEDLRQELLVRLLERLPSFDPAKGHWHKYATTIVERAVANILREMMAEKRNPKQICSLSILVNVDGNGLSELSQLIGDDDYNARRLRHPRSAEELARLAFDVTEFIAKLPKDLRRLAKDLQKKSIAQTARDLGIPRTTLNMRVRTLRLRFQDSGLRDYF